MPFYCGMAPGGSSRGELPGISLRRKQSHLPGVVENRDRRMTALFSFSCEFCVPWDQESWSLLLDTSLLCCCPSRILHLPGTLSPLEELLVTEHRAGDSETTCEPSLTLHATSRACPTFKHPHSLVFSNPCISITVLMTFVTFSSAVGPLGQMGRLCTLGRWYLTFLGFRISLPRQM